MNSLCNNAQHPPLQLNTVDLLTLDSLLTPDIQCQQPVL